MGSSSLAVPDACAAGKKYRDRLVRDGGSDILVKGEDGTICPKFHAWLADAGPEAREHAADLILSSFEAATPFKEVGKELRKITGLCNRKSYALARRELRRLKHEHEFSRFRVEGVRQGVWKLDLEEGTHTVLKGKIFGLDDPVWRELDLEGCVCWCEPVTRDQ